MKTGSRRSRQSRSGPRSALRDNGLTIKERTVGRRSGGRQTAANQKTVADECGALPRRRYVLFPRILGLLLSFRGLADKPFI